MSLMSGLYVGTTGLMTSSNALNTTAHNLSNIQTDGYTRQQVLQEDKFYNRIGNASVSDKQIGLGVEYARVRQVRDYFLDQSYRKESGRSAFYELNYETTNEIETLLGEFDGVAFQDSMKDIWTAIQELQKDPTSPVVQGELVNTCSQFIDRAQSVYNGLVNYQDNLNARVKDYVDRINEIGDEIYDLNVRINKEEVKIQKGDDLSQNVSEANDLRDRRNALLDELSGIAKISYFTNADNAVEVSVEGVPLVARDRVFKMEMTVDDGTGFYTPIWPQNGNVKVFDPTQEISSNLDTDIGELKSIILARGDRRANYTDIQEADYYGGEDFYNTGKDISTTPPTQMIPTASSIVMNTMAELDNLVHNMMISINDILCGEDGIDPSARTGIDEDDAFTRYEMFQRLGTDDRYEKQADGTYSYIAEKQGLAHADVSTLYTLGNVKINPALLKEPTKLSFETADKNADRTKADKLAKAFTDAFGALNPNLTMEYNFQDYYSAMVGQIATTGSVFKSIVDAQQLAVAQIDDSRQSIMGVSSNEELSNMIKFQNAYNAASRYITACNDMLENLIQNLA